MDLKSLAEKYATYQGDPESESILVNHKADEKEGYVTVWAGRGRDIRRIIRRCGSTVLSFEDRGYGVEFQIKSSAFRGIPFAFKKMKPGP